MHGMSFSVSHPVSCCHMLIIHNTQTEHKKLDSHVCKHPVSVYEQDRLLGNGIKLSELNVTEMQH